MAILSVLFGFAAFVSFVSGDVDCSQQDACENGQYTCSGSGCTIDCTGQDSCEDSEFTCTSSCTVDCSSEDTCGDATFYFSGGDVSVLCKGQDSCEDARFVASNGTTVSFACDGSDSCEDAYIEMEDTSTFSITCDGSNACEELECVCGESGCETNGNIECENSVNKHSKHQKGGPHHPPRSRLFHKDNFQPKGKFSKFGKVF